MKALEVMRKLGQPINEDSGFPVIELGRDRILVGWGDQLAVFVGNKCLEILPAENWPVPEEPPVSFYDFMTSKD